jgi:hypothetical protein
LRATALLIATDGLFVTRSNLLATLALHHPILPSPAFLTLLRQAA